VFSQCGRETRPTGYCSLCEDTSATDRLLLMLPRLLRAANSRPRYMQRGPNVAEQGDVSLQTWSPSETSSPKLRCLGMHDGHCRRRPTVQGDQAEPTQHALQFRYARPYTFLVAQWRWGSLRGGERSDTSAEQSINWQVGITLA